MVALLAPSHLSTEHTNSTVVSDYFAQSGAGSTALTSPSLYPISPGRKPHHLGDIHEERARPMDPTHTQDPDDSLDESLYADDPASASPPQDVRRGPSVKSRASTYEQSLSGHSSAGLGLDSERPKSRAASPFRLPPSPGLHGLDVPRHEQHRPPSAGRSRSPMRLPASPGHRSPSPAHYAPRASSPLKMLQPLHSHSGHHTGLEPPSPSNAPSHSSRELPHSPCGTMPDLPFECPTSTPRRKRVPVPAEASAQVSPSPKVARGDSSARRMIAQWENGIQEPPSTVRGLEAPGSPSPRRPMPQGYLNDKPLPIPTATAIPASSNMPWPPPSSSRAPPGGLQMPQPLRGERTPNSKPDHMSPSSWSPVQRGKRSENAKSDWSAALSPSKSSGKSPMKRSPFKDIVNKFTGRKKDKEPSYDSSTGAGPQSQRFISLDDDKEWFAQSLPANGGVGFSDRMGDEEMAPAPWYDRDAIRSSAVLFLPPTPVSSVTAWGSWLTAWATLTPKCLSITYAPTVPGGSPRSAPPYASIPKPAPESRPEVELDMRDCVEVRSLRPSEVRGRGIPPVPEGGGSEVLEIAFSRGLKRYVAVEGVAGRLGWVSAIWDVLLACKQEPGADMNLPPPSPSIAAYSSTVNHIVLSRGLHDAPVQRYGDTWVASGDLDGANSTRGPLRALPVAPDVDQLPQPVSSGAETFDFKPGEIIPPGIKPGDTISTLHRGLPSPLVTASPVVATVPPTSQRRSFEDKELPPPPPAEPQPRSGLVSERIQAWTVGETASPARPLPVPVPRAASPPLSANSLQQSGEGTVEDSRFSSTRSADKSLGHSSGATFANASSSSTPLRKALVQMFDAASAEEDANAPKKTRSTVMEERIRAWQPNADATPPPLSRSSTRREAESTVSVDPSDLNPSRSASQVRPRVDSEVGLDLGAVNVGLSRDLPMVPEAASSPVDRSFGPRAQRKPSPNITPAAVLTPAPAAALSTGKADPPLRETPASGLKPPVAEGDKRPASPVTTPRMNSRLLAAAAVFEPAIGERLNSAPSTLSQRKPVASRSVAESPVVESTKPSLPAVKVTPRSEPKTDAEAISEIQSVRSGLRAVKSQERVLDTPTQDPLEVRSTAPLDFNKFRSRKLDSESDGVSKAVEKEVVSQPLEKEAVSKPLPSIALLNPGLNQRATSSTSTTSQVTSLLPPYRSAESGAGQTSTVEAVESSMPPSRGVPGTSRSLLNGASSELGSAESERDAMTGIARESEYAALSERLDSMRAEMTAIAASIGGVGALVQAKGEHDPALPQMLGSRLDKLDDSMREVHGAVEGIADVPPAFAQRFESIGSDLRGIQILLTETSAQVAEMAVNQQPAADDLDKEKGLPPMPQEVYTEVAEPLLPEIHAKLDALAHLIQELLQRQGDLAVETAAIGAATAAAAAAAQEKAKEEEAAPPPAVEEAPPTAPAVEPATATQLDEVAGMVAKLEAERALQAQQTADIARYLGDLNGWLEKFVQNSGGELASMTRSLEGMAGDTALVPQIHGMVAEQMTRPVGEGGIQAQRVDALVAMMAEDRERQQQQVNVVEHVVGLLDKQRQDNENLLRAVATDLTSEIRGERVKFIDAMQQATSMNMQIHVDEFKKALTNEVSLSMRELGELREQKKVLQHQIADLFSLMAKHGEENRPPPGMFPPSPGLHGPPGPRSLPQPPH